MAFVMQISRYARVAFLCGSMRSESYPIETESFPADFVARNVYLPGTHLKLFFLEFILKKHTQFPTRFPAQRFIYADNNAQCVTIYI